VAEILGASSQSIFALVSAIFSAPAQSGYPNAQIGAFLALLSSAAIIVLSLMIVINRSLKSLKPLSFLILILGITAFGGVEFAREDLRKPFVLGRLMFVNGVRLPVSATEEGVLRQMGGSDRFEIRSLQEKGILSSALWSRSLPSDLTGNDQNVLISEGKEVFRLSCSSCHTENGFLAIRPLVQGKNISAITRILDQMAVPVNEQLQPVGWTESYSGIQTWRGRRMPPFVGNDREKESLSLYLASLGGGSLSDETASAGEAVFDENCVFCHSEEADWPMSGLIRGRNPDQLYEVIGDLPGMNPIMPPFEGTEQQRKDLAEFLSTLGPGLK
jgi:mono/diheme cytochrome c family protein